MTISKKLFSYEKSEYGEKYHDHVLDIYKLYVENADQISARRQSANSFFLTINTGIVGALSFFVGKNEGEHWVISIFGVLLCYVWYRLLRSYRDINSAKFRVIHEIERKIPLAPFDAEWEAVGRGKDNTLYLPFTKIEFWVPRILGSFYFILMLKYIFIPNFNF